MNNKIKILLLLTIVAMAVAPEASAFPGETRACNGAGCHAFPPTTINITTNISSITVTPGQSFVVGITWNGGDPAATTEINWPTNFANIGIIRNNTLFNPTPRVPASVQNTITGNTISTLTAPATTGNHIIRVYTSRGSATIPRETDFKDIAVTVQNPAAVNIIPSIQTVLSNQIFTVNITIDPAGNPTNGVQFDLTFNPAVVRVDIVGGNPNVTEGDFFVQGGATSTFTAVGGAQGPLTVSGNITPGVNVTAKGNVSMISLRAQGTGITSLNLSNINVTSSSGASIPAIVNNGSVTVVAAPAFGVNLTVDNANKSTVVNTNATYVLTVNNTGNVQDTFNFAPPLNPQGASIAALSTSSITLNANAIGTVLLNVTNATPGNFVVNVTATSAGNPAISATVTTNTTVTTQPPALATITVTPANASVIVGNTTTFIAAPKDQFGAPFPATVTWSSSNGTVGGINAATGVFTASVAGTTTITATNATTGIFGTASVTVTTAPPVLTSITVTPATAVLAVGGTQTFTAAPKDQDGNAIPAIVTWSSSNGTVGTINATTGVFTANASGTTTITATNGTIFGSATVKVLIASINSFTLPVATGGLLGLINANVNVTNSDTISQNFMVHVSGVDAAGNSLVGNTLVMNLGPNQSVNVTVQLPIPQLTPTGNYALFAAIWKSADFPAGPQIITTTVPLTATVV